LTVTVPEPETVESVPTLQYAESIVDPLGICAVRTNEKHGVFVGSIYAKPVTIVPPYSYASSSVSAIVSV